MGCEARSRSVTHSDHISDQSQQVRGSRIGPRVPKIKPSIASSKDFPTDHRDLQRAVSGP